MAMLIFMQFHHGEWSAENLFIFPENVTHPSQQAISSSDRVTSYVRVSPLDPNYRRKEIYIFAICRILRIKKKLRGVQDTSQSITKPNIVLQIISNKKMADKLGKIANRTVTNLINTPLSGIGLYSTSMYCEGP